MILHDVSKFLEKEHFHPQCFSPSGITVILQLYILCFTSKETKLYSKNLLVKILLNSVISFTCILSDYLPNES